MISDSNSEIFRRLVIHRRHWNEDTAHVGYVVTHEKNGYALWATVADADGGNEEFVRFYKAGSGVREDALIEAARACDNLAHHFHTADKKANAA